MNRVPKLVASRAITDLSAWKNSAIIDGDLISEVAKQKTERDVIVAGSASVVHALAERSLVDEYRILVFPELVGPAALWPPGGAVGVFDDPVEGGKGDDDGAVHDLLLWWAGGAGRSGRRYLPAVGAELIALTATSSATRRWQRRRDPDIPWFGRWRPSPR
jgi:hypothetical protein